VVDVYWLKYYKPVEPYIIALVVLILPLTVSLDIGLYSPIPTFPPNGYKVSPNNSLLFDSR